jgi:DNA-binding LacI/PurR family transcriptional regulator
MNQNIKQTKERQILSGLLEEISKKGSRPGFRLPRESEYVVSLGVSRTTIRRAMGRLEKLGIVERVQGSGTYVKYIPTPRQIQQVLQSLEFNPGFGDSAAETAETGALRIGVFHAMGIHTVFQNWLEGVSGRLGTRSHELVLGQIWAEKEAAPVHHFSHRVLSQNCDGMILLGRFHREHFDLLNDLVRIPYVIFNNSFFFNNVIGMDYHSASMLALERLRARNCRQVAIIEKRHKKDSSLFGFLSDSYLQAMGLEEMKVWVFFGPEPYKKYLDSGFEADSLIFSDDVHLTTVYRDLRDRFGEGIEVTTVSSYNRNIAIPPKVNLVMFDYSETGALATNILLHMIENGTRSCAPIRVGATYIPYEDRKDGELFNSEDAVMIA